jgi:polyketide cyclase/dehydrase/lipid transport protein
VTHTLRPEDLDFLSAAPKKWTFDAEVAAPPENVFAAISSDPSTWTWFPGLSSGGYEDAGPHGVGSRRHVTMTGTTYRETILAWDPPGRWAYRVDETSVPLAHALVEDWVIEAKGDGAVVRWTFAIEPRPLFRAGMAVAPKVMGGLFRKAMANLSRELAHR